MDFLGLRRPDRRRWKRQSFNLPLRIVTDSAVIDGRGIRMSEGGMYLFSASNLDLGSNVKIDFPSAGERQARSGVVRYRALYLYGVEFSGA